MAVAILIYIKESGSPEGPVQLSKKLPGDFQDLDRVRELARGEKAPEDGYVLQKIYFLGEHSSP